MPVKRGMSTRNATACILTRENSASWLSWWKIEIRLGNERLVCVMAHNGQDDVHQILYQTGVKLYKILIKLFVHSWVSQLLGRSLTVDFHFTAKLLITSSHLLFTTSPAIMKLFNDYQHWMPSSIYRCLHLGLVGMRLRTAAGRSWHKH